VTARADGAPDRIAFLGFGLIGGSIAKALRAGGWSATATAWTPSGGSPAAGRELELVEAAASPEDALEGADLVVLAAPPLAVLELLDRLAGPWKRALATEAVVTDVASTKVAIVARANELGIRFVGGHPMAGRERSGVDAATADLFVDRPWVLVPGAASPDADLARARWLPTSVGARPIELTAEDHDRAVAAISHLPLVAAAALVEAVVGQRWTTGNDPSSQLAASGWTDMTRLVRGDPEMGAGILATNAPEVAAQVRALRDVLDRWLDVLEGDAPNADEIQDRLREARDRLGPANT